VLSFNLPAAGLKSPNYVEFWMHISSRIPVESGHLQLNINGLSAKMHLQWVGWNLVRIPLSAMKESPESTLSPGVFELVRTGTFPADFSIHYTAPSINPKPTGTSLSDRDLLDHIDLDNPLLADVRAVAETGDINATLKALAKHFRKDFRSRHPLPEGDIDQSALVEGAKILEGQVRLTAGVGLTHNFPGGKIDWSFNPTQGKSNFTHEWGWSTNRHGWWQRLANAYSVNKEDKYAAFWAMQFRDWVQQCPVPAIAQEHGGSRWRGLEAGLRTTRVWPVTFLALAQSPGVPDADILLFLKLLISHGNYLSAHPYKPGNHYMIGMVGLYTIGVVFPELSDAVHWRKQGFDNLSNSIARNSLDEGAWYELSPAYHQWCANLALGALEIAKRNGGTTESEKAAVAKLQKLCEWNVYLTTPDGIAPRLNDGGLVNVNNDVQKAADVFTESILLQWGARKPNAPEPSFKSIALRDSGYFISRTGWKKDDSYNLFDVGPLGGWHGHQDALNVVTYFFGRHFLFDNGGYKYDTSEWRKYGITTAAHNTAMIDSLGQYRGYNNETDIIGKNSKETPVPIFAIGDKIDYASGWYCGDYGVKSKSKRIANHRREIAFLKPNGTRNPLMVVVDNFTPLDNAPHHYEVRWHLLTTQWQTGMAGRCVWTTDSGRPNLAVLVLDGADEYQADSGVKKPQLLGWDFVGQGGGEAPALTLRQSRKAAGPVRMITVLVPFKESLSNPVEAVKSGKNTWTVTIKGQPPLTLDFNDGASPVAPSFTVRDLAWPALK
jgi:hypothetical protein